MAAKKHWRMTCQLLHEAEVSLRQDTSIVLYNCAMLSVEDWQKAVLLLEAATLQDLQPSVVSLNSLIAACAAAAAWEKALHVFSSSASLEGDLTSLNSAMTACRNATRWDVVLGLFKAQGHRLPMSSDVITFNIMAGACAAVHQWQQAITFLQDMLQHALTPTSSTFNTLMTGCEQAQQWWRAFVLYEKMQHLGIQADATTHGTLLSAMERANHWQHAAYALCTGVFSNRALLNGVLNASSSSGQWELTLQLLHSGHETDMLSFGTTALALAKGHHWQHIVALLEGLGFQPRSKKTLMLKTLQLALEEGHCRGLTVKHHSIPSTDLWRSRQQAVP
ncbi:Pentatricopeptide repeat-containing protein At2g31400 [Durusdinium trenchii]|uniref:Chloroplastic n=1 Tax=Durusdinium trenchii TaxID=1381693 RepID=A0ABP0I694_9DINO